MPHTSSGTFSHTGQYSSPATAFTWSSVTAAPPVAGVGAGVCARAVCASLSATTASAISSAAIIRLEHDDLRGPFNMVAPYAVRNESLPPRWAG